MAETAEGLVKKEIKAILTEFSAPYSMSVTSGYGRSGVLDFTVCVPPDGRYLSVEAKSIHSPYGKQGPTELQHREIQTILVAGGIALVINETNYQELKEALHDCATGQYDRARDRALRAYRRSPHRAPDPLQAVPELAPPVLRRRR